MSLIGDGLAMSGNGVGRSDRNLEKNMQTADELMDGDRLLTPGEVAVMFRVDPKTVTRWAAAGRIGSTRTPGGHRRFRESEVRKLLAEGSRPRTMTPNEVYGKIKKEN